MSSLDSLPPLLCSVTWNATPMLAADTFAEVMVTANLSMQPCKKRKRRCQQQQIDEDGGRHSHLEGTRRQWVRARW